MSDNPDHAKLMAQRSRGESRFSSEQANRLEAQVSAKGDKAQYGDHMIAMHAHLRAKVCAAAVGNTILSKKHEDLENKHRGFLTP
jgi:hypothetical protein